MQRGKPVVATPVGGTAEVVVHGETGLIVPVREPQVLADALRELLADPARAQTLGEAGRRRARERYSAAASVQRTLEVYDELAR